MTWSKAARDAAAEVRRIHTQAKGEGRQRMLGMNAFDKTLKSDKGYRVALAKHLRNFRTGGAARKASMRLGYRLESSSIMSGVAADARASTAARNILKVGKRGR